MQILAIGGAIQNLQNWMIALGIPELLAFILTAAVCVAGASILTVGLMVLIWRNRKALVRDRDLKLVRFGPPRLPGISLLNALRIPTPTFKVDLSGFRGIGMALGVVAVGFALAFTFVIAGTDDTPVWPEVGAAYPLPVVQGVKLEPSPENPADANQTLQINLAAGVRLNTLTLDNLDLGKAGLTDCITIQRTTNTTGWLYVDTWSMTGVSAPSLSMENVESASLLLSAQTDGHALDATIDSTITEMNIESSRGSGDFLAENSVVDRVIIEMHGDATIGVMAWSDLDCSVGGWNIDWVKAGVITMDNTSKFGDGDGIDLADFVVASTVKARTITDNLVDVPITVK
tara:strand:+ start:193 stop:1227 length:1035 start_codon:yes stop_codon:yes gene_type:complete